MNSSKSNQFYPFDRSYRFLNSVIFPGAGEYLVNQETAEKKIRIVEAGDLTRTILKMAITG